MATRSTLVTCGARGGERRVEWRVGTKAGSAGACCVAASEVGSTVAEHAACLVAACLVIGQTALPRLPHLGVPVPHDEHDAGVACVVERLVVVTARWQKRGQGECGSTAW